VSNSDLRGFAIESPWIVATVLAIQAGRNKAVGVLGFCRLAEADPTRFDAIASDWPIVGEFAPASRRRRVRASHQATAQTHRERYEKKRGERVDPCDEWERAR
jgi:hypothetical protein